MSEYLGMVEFTAGKGADQAKRLVSFEGRAKSQKKATKLFAGAAKDQAMAAEQVEVLAVSRMKDGAPVDTAIMAWKPAMTVILAPSYKPDVASDKFDAVWQDAKPTKAKGTSLVSYKAKRPDLVLPFGLKDMDALADRCGVIRYDLANKEVSEDE